MMMLANGLITADVINAIMRFLFIVSNVVSSNILTNWALFCMSDGIWKFLNYFIFIEL
jgi:hypothetical protein